MLYIYIYIRIYIYIYICSLRRSNGTTRTIHDARHTTCDTKKCWRKLQGVEGGRAQGMEHMWRMESLHQVL